MKKVHKKAREKFNTNQPSVAFPKEISHLICCANQMTGFYMKCNNGIDATQHKIDE